MTANYSKMIVVPPEEEHPKSSNYNTIQISYDHNNSDIHSKSIQEWSNILPNAAFFSGSDILFGDVIAIVFEDPKTKKIGTVLISKLGESKFNSLTIDARSKYFPACENLLPKYKKSNVRRSLAITILRTYASLGTSIKNYLVNHLNSAQSLLYDETNAGDLANSLTLINDKPPKLIGKKILNLGFLQPKAIDSMVLDVIYSSESNENDNNKLVYLLGEQLDQLFDPLTEYSPESTDKIYTPPSSKSTNGINITNDDDELIQSIIKELIKVQTNFTINLVDFLQNFVVPLRIEVLNNKIENLSITRLNSIFPPTIDEITRINCIFQSALNSASPYGSYEILKACGTTIPYFYKAYMRHEAATRFFDKKFNNFLKSYSSKLPGNIDINLYTKNKVSSIVSGSLNLPKLKLILDRLVSTKNWQPDQLETVGTYHQSSIDTINAFGKDPLKPYDHRVFTPTGKLLTELANNWPVELQHGWLSRRVVGIFDATNLLNNSIMNTDVIIIFSDHILFLNICDEAYYGLGDIVKDESVHVPAIADILMHSLINEVPLTNLPSMKVVGWADMNDVIVSTYSNKTCLEFLVINDGIKPSASKNFTRNYLIKSPNLNNGSRIIELINKAKVLFKNQPFHLFKMSNAGLSIFSTAHNLDVYKHERGKSPFALFLNMDVSRDVLYKYNLYAVLGAKFIDNKIKVTGINKLGTEINSVIEPIDFDKFVCEELSKLFGEYLSFDNRLLNEIYIQILKSNVKNINGFVKSDKKKEAKLLKEIKHESKFPVVESALKNNIDSFQSIGGISNSGTIRRSQDLSHAERANYATDVANKRNATKSDAPNLATNMPEKRLKRKSFISRLFSKSDKSKNVKAKEKENISKRRSISNFLSETGLKNKKSSPVLSSIPIHSNIPGSFDAKKSAEISSNTKTHRVGITEDSSDAAKPPPLHPTAANETDKKTEYNSFSHIHKESSTEKNVSTLDQWHSTSVRQKLNELTKYGDNDSDFYNDDEGNWVIARDNSSLANIRAEALKNETSVDTEETLYKSRKTSENYDVFSSNASSYCNIKSHITGGPYESIDEQQASSALTLNDHDADHDVDIPVRYQSPELYVKPKLTSKGREKILEQQQENEAFYTPASSNQNISNLVGMGDRELSASTIINSSSHSLYSLISGHESVKVISKATRQPMTWYSSNDVDILKNVKNESVSDSFLIHEKSYQYLSDILSGNLVINVSDDDDIKEEDEGEEEEINCTDTIFNKSFKESSLNYLSNYITSGRTVPKNLDKFEGDEDYYFV